MENTPYLVTYATAGSPGMRPSLVSDETIFDVTLEIASLDDDGFAVSDDADQTSLPVWAFHIVVSTFT